jgi:hypothetical protein
VRLVYDHKWLPGVPGVGWVLQMVSEQTLTVYDHKGLPGVPGVGWVLQMVSEQTLAVSRTCTGQLRRIRWRTDQGREYVRITRVSSERNTV